MCVMCWCDVDVGYVYGSAQQDVFGLWLSDYTNATSMSVLKHWVINKLLISFQLFNIFI